MFTLHDWLTKIIVGLTPIHLGKIQPLSESERAQAQSLLTSYRVNADAARFRPIDSLMQLFRETAGVEAVGV
jgi:hypothetical protein